MANYRAVIVGSGFMGRTHLEALRRLGNVDAFNVGRADGDLGKFFNDPAIHAVHVCTPNVAHFPIAKAALEAGKHVLCEKPLAMSVAEAAQLVKLAEQHKLRNATCHNLRFYPMVQQMRAMREAGELGEILVAQGTYSQDWLLYDTDWNWRIDPSESGRSRCLADIGSHWCDMAEHVTGLRISEVCADMQIFHKTRKRPKVVVETFAGKTLRPEDYEEVAIETEDFASVLVRFGEPGQPSRGRGAFTASQVSAGLKNGLQMEIYGTKASVTWNQERPNELWIGHRNDPNHSIVKDPALLTGSAPSFAEYPGGHAEGYPDTFKQVFRRFYASIGDPNAAPEYPQFADGLRQLKILDAEIASSQKRAWVEVAQ